MLFSLVDYLWSVYTIRENGATDEGVKHLFLLFKQRQRFLATVTAFLGA